MFIFDELRLLFFRAMAHLKMFRLQHVIAAGYRGTSRRYYSRFVPQFQNVKIPQPSTQSTASLNLITAFSDTSPSTPLARSNTLGFGCFVS